MAQSQAAQQAALDARLQAQERNLARAVDERLGDLNKRIGYKLQESTEKAGKSLSDLASRLAIIDRAQANIMELSGQVVGLQNILSNKQARGAFGEIQLQDLISEILAPGSFMLWLALSAILVGAISTAVVWSWQAQLIAFAVFAIASIPVWRHFARKVEQPVERPFLNRRAEGYVGREFTLDKPIVDGVGTIRIDDTVWRVSGPDCPAGSRVKVARADGANLLVEASA